MEVVLERVIKGKSERELLLKVEGVAFDQYRLVRPYILMIEARYPEFHCWFKDIALNKRNYSGRTPLRHGDIVARVKFDD